MEEMACLAKRISSQEELNDAYCMCVELFNIFFKKNTQNSDTENTNLFEEACDALRAELKRNYIENDFSNVELCKLTHEVLRIRLQKL
ncbi:MAG: hypothetical protein WCI36_00820 [bacterium]